MSVLIRSWWARTLPSLMLGCLVGLGACSNADGTARQDGGARDAAGPRGDDDAGGGGGEQRESSATLRDAVTVIDAERADFVLDGTEDEWTLRDKRDLAVGDVLLLEDALVRVTRVETRAGNTVLGVEQAALEDAFSALTLDASFDLSQASFEPAPGSSAKLRAQRGVDKDVEGSLDAEERLAVEIKEGPFAGQLSFGLRGQLSFEWDEEAGAGTRGGLDLTADVRSSLRVKTADSLADSLPERRLGQLRIPIPFTVFDKLLRFVGIRVASVWVPVSVGADLKLSFALDLTLEGAAQTGLSLRYTEATGLAVTGPNNAATFGATGMVEDAAPGAAVAGTLAFGPYVRARPQLLILNEVASMGADLKLALYARGQLSFFPAPPPYYCLSLRPELEGTVFGFMKAVGAGALESEPVSSTLPVTGGYTNGFCGDAGMDDGGAMSGMDAGLGDAATLADASGGDANADVDAGDGDDGGAPDASPIAEGGGGPASDPPPTPPGNGAVFRADPHLRTFDGVLYDMQAVGELTAVAGAGDGFEVQVRTEPYTVFIPASVNIAIAARIGADRVAVYLGDGLRVNGERFSARAGANPLPGGGTLYALGNRTVLVGGDNTQVHITRNHPAFLDLDVFVPDARRGQLVGLLGDCDGQSNGDLRVRDGAALAEQPSFEEFYRVYAESWRVTQQTSLFDYGADETTETFTDRSFPPGQASLDDVNATDRASAEAICRAANVPESWLASCILDVSITGDASFARAFEAVPPATAIVQVQTPRAASGLSLADVVGGGDGSGNGSARAIHMLTGEPVTAHASLMACPSNSFVPSPSPYVDGVFCPDGAPDGSAVVQVSSTGLTLTGLPDWLASYNAGSTWDHLWNGMNLNVSTTLAGRSIGAHANKGITFDLAALAQQHRRPFTRFAVGAAFGATTLPAQEPNVGFIVALDGVKLAEHLGTRPPESVIPLQFAIPRDARFLTLITAAAGDIANDWSFWLEPRLFLEGSPDVYQFTRAPESMSVSRVGERELVSDATQDGVFEVNLRGPVSALVLYAVDAQGNALAGQQWDTTRLELPASTGAPFLDSAATWFLGVEEGGQALHLNDGDFAITDNGLHQLKLYAQNSGMFAGGNYFRLAAVSGGKAVSLSPVLTY